MGSRSAWQHCQTTAWQLNSDRLLGPRSGLVPLEVLAAAGVRRVSVGGVIARAAYGQALEYGRALLAGDLPHFAAAPTHAAINGLMRGREERA